ncbi:hypothetical protein ACTXQV_52565, partial [Klebsiella pneumoniae]
MRQSLPALTEEIKTPAVNGAPPALDLRGIRKSWGQHEVLSAEKIYSNGTRALLPVNLTINQG